MRKRRFAWMIGALAALSLVASACNGGDGAAPDDGQEDGEATPQIETIQEGVLTVGSDIPYPPFEFRQGGELTGFDIALVEEIGTRLGLEVQFTDTDFDTIFTQVGTGRFDAAVAASTITPERERDVNFSDPYFKARQSLTVNTQERSDITSADDLGEGDTVGVQNGTTGQQWAQDNLEPEGVQIRGFPEAGEAYTALEAGQVDGVVNDEVSAVFEVEDRTGLEIVEAFDTDEFYGIAVNPDNEALLEAINDALAEIIEDGTYDQIYDEFIFDFLGNRDAAITS